MFFFYMKKKEKTTTKKTMENSEGVQVFLIAHCR